MASVPELDFQAAPAKDLPPDEIAKNTAHMLAGINFLNGRKTDGFLLALAATGPTWTACPSPWGTPAGPRASATVSSPSRSGWSARRCKRGRDAGPQDRASPAATATTPTPSGSSSRRLQQQKGRVRYDRGRREAVTTARAAALMQMLAPETPDLRLGLVKYLSGVSHAEATRALARLAIFCAEDEVRQAAVDALQVRRERDYTDILLKACATPGRPWPGARPRPSPSWGAPTCCRSSSRCWTRRTRGARVARSVDGKQVLVVRELVRINHNRNCLLCHSPGNADGVSAETLTAPMPLPSEPLGTPANGYQTSSPDLLVRIDVTYLRQDFSGDAAG